MTKHLRISIGKLPVVIYFCLVIYIISCDKSSPTHTINCYPNTTQKDTAVLLVIGQSNAANFGLTTHLAACEHVLNFYAGDFYPCADPLKGAAGTKGSVWSRLGDVLIDSAFAKVVIIAPCAIGGTTLQQWKPGGINNHYIIETIQQLQAKGLTITHILWHQGEANNSSALLFSAAQQNARQYQTDFRELVAQIRSMGVEAPVFPAIATQCRQSADTLLQHAQRELASESAGIFNGPNTDALGDEYRFDGCHFNEEGLNKHAQLWADILLKHH
ncbi:MAG: sialate O-acetylesterase [Chitinophagales bacterium]